MLTGRRTPWVAIAFTTVLGIVLVSTGDLSTLADMTVVLLLAVFVLVNVSVLVLRRDRVAHDHFRAPIALPVIGAIVSVGVMFTKEGEVFLRAGALLALGVVFWLVNLVALRGRREFDTGVLEAVKRPPPPE